MNIQKNVSLKYLNTFGIDVKAKLFAEFNSEQELKELLLEDEIHKSRKLILGGGSNVLFTGDFDGAVLLNRIKGIDVEKEDQDYALVKAGSGEVWHDLVLKTIEMNLGGIENLSLIPGTVGAAPIQNIGAYGAEVKDVFDFLQATHINTGESRTFDAEQCCFGYRDSVFKNEFKGEYIITSVTLKLKKDPEFNTSYGAITNTLKELGIKELSLKAVSDAVIHIRKSKLPDPAQIGNAGSFFKNPEIPVSQFEKLKKEYPEIPSYPTSPGMVKIPAGWLNEQCGWKGKCIGNAGVHKLQALVLVNLGGATGTELKNLAEQIKQSVKEKFGIELETEVNIV